MVRIAGKHAFLELLRDEGIDIIFGNPGSTELALMDALAIKPSPRFVLGLHEGIVMSMAHGYAAATGRLAAVNLHAAPGLGNALGMLYNIKKANAPVLVTAGQQDLSIAVREPLLWDDLATMARPFVKWSVEVTRLADLPRIVRRAAKVAMTRPPGRSSCRCPATYWRRWARSICWHPAVSAPPSEATPTPSRMRPA
jgi:benzoylformate decarboxylase